jgi:hypothetical protein
MNAALKISVPPLTFEEFNALDVLASVEVAELTAELRSMDADAARRPTVERFLQRAREAQAKLAAVRPPAYAQMIRAQFERGVCDGDSRPEADPLANLDIHIVMADRVN